MKTKTSLVATLLASVAAVGLASATVGGCFWATTKSEGKALRKDIDSLDSRVATKETELNGQIEQLKIVLDDATKVLKRNSADLGADVDQLRDDMRKASGLVSGVTTELSEVRTMNAKLETRIAALEARLTTLETVKPATPPPVAATADTLWNDGKVAFEAGRYDEAREAFKKLVATFPNSERADDAQYFRGESYFKQADYDKAIAEYQKVFDKWEASQLADDALFRAAEAATALKNCAEARAYYGLLKQKYAKSTLLAKAATNDKALASSLKNKAKCNQ